MKPLNDLEIEVIELYKSGRRVTEVAAVLGLSANFVMKTLKDHGAYDPGRDQAGWTIPGSVLERLMPIVDQLYNRYLSGARIIDLALENECSPSSIKKAFREAGYSLIAIRQRRRYGKMRVGPDEFIEAWQSSSTLDEVAEKTGMKKAAISARAYAYKKRGVVLKKMAYPKYFDWDALKELADLFKEDADAD